MKAFNNDPKLKADLLILAKQHEEQDRFIKGAYEEFDDDGNFKGCAVGCTLYSYYEINSRKDGDYSDHSMYEEFGIPQVLARLEDRIFEGLPESNHQSWPVQFLEAIPVGADLSGVWPKFAIYLLSDPDDGVIQYANDDTKDIIRKIVAMHESGDYSQAKELRDDAYAAYAADAADAARAAYAAARAADAAYAAAAAYAAYAADAADAARAAADAADAAADAADAAYTKQSEKLLELLRDAK